MSIQQLWNNVEYLQWMVIILTFILVMSDKK